MVIAGTFFLPRDGMTVRLGGVLRGWEVVRVFRWGFAVGEVKLDGLSGSLLVLGFAGFSEVGIFCYANGISVGNF